jgi:23S rRNA (pseudouridine1915-N3)-methyltransferase
VKILIRAVGKMRDRRLEDVCNEYLQRTRRHVPVEVAEVEDDASLLRGLPAGTEIVALEPGGKSFTTPAFSAFISERMLRGTKGIAFLIGGADGLRAETVAKAHVRLSLSPMTLPHRLARVVLCEQIYRVLSELRGEPYSR